LSSRNPEESLDPEAVEILMKPTRSTQNYKMNYLIKWNGKSGGNLSVEAARSSLGRYQGDSGG